MSILIDTQLSVDLVEATTTISPPDSPSSFPLSADSTPASSPADDEIDQLAALASSSPSSFLSLLSLLRPRLFSFSSLSAQSNEVDPSTPLSLESRRVSAHFSALKLSFLHLEAKQKFLSWLVNDEAVPLVSAEEEQEAEHAIREGKKEVAEIKRGIEEKKEQVEGVIRQLVQLWKEVEHDAHTIHSTWKEDEWTELRRLMEQINETEPSLLCSQPHLDELVERHQSTVTALTVSLDAARAEEATMTAEVETVEEEVKRLEAEERAVQAKCRDEEGVQQRHDWWQRLLAVHGRLSGVEISRKEGNDRSLIVRVNGWGGEGTEEEVKGVEMEIDCVPGSHNFNGVSLINGDLDSAVWDELVDYALELQDLGWMIREVQAQLMQKAE